MIDYFALALTHGLILLALIRMAGRPELDIEPGLEPDRKPRGRRTEPAGPADDGLSGPAND